jgi:sn-glycerol 3-phosphate transport system substrate-binding protein
MKRVVIILFVAVAFSVATAQTTIEFWYAFSDAARSGWIQERMDEWNADNPNFQVVGQRYGNYPETLNAVILAARQGNPPHLVQLFEVGSQLAVDSGIFEPIGNVGGGIDLSDYIEPVINYYTIEGAVNSIPFNSSSPILYINQDLLEAAGLDPELEPQTYGEILEACEQIAASEIDATCIGFNLHSWFFEQWMAQQGAPLVNNDNGRNGRATEVLLTSEAAYNIVNWIKTLNDSGYYTYSGALEDWDGSDAIFTNQRVVFHITSTADLGNIGRAAEESGFSLNTGLLPIPDGVDRNGVVIGGASVWLTTGHPAEELEAARDFILYMTNTENMISWHKLTGYYPVRNSSVEQLETEGWFEENPNYGVAFEQLLNTVPNTATAGALLGTFQETRTIIEEAIQRVLQGESVEASLEQAKRLADAQLQDYNRDFQ